MRPGDEAYEALGLGLFKPRTSVHALLPGDSSDPGCLLPLSMVLASSTHRQKNNQVHDVAKPRCPHLD